VLEQAEFNMSTCAREEAQKAEQGSTGPPELAPQRLNVPRIGRLCEKAWPTGDLPGVAWLAYFTEVSTAYHERKKRAKFMRKRGAP
jgi:hypothetical protein